MSGKVDGTTNHTMKYKISEYKIQFHHIKAFETKSTLLQKLPGNKSCFLSHDQVIDMCTTGNGTTLNTDQLQSRDVPNYTLQ